MIKRFVKSHDWVNDVTTSWGGVPNGTLSMSEVCLFESGVSSFSIAFRWLWAIQNGWSFCWLWTSQNWFIFTYVWQVTVILMSLDKMLGRKKAIHNLSVWQKIQEPCIGSGMSHFQSAGIKNWVNGLQRLNL